MTARASPFVASMAWTLSAGSLVLLAISTASGAEENLFHYQDAAVGVVFPALGWLVLHRQGSHPVGWILMVAGVSGGLGAFAEEYVTVGYDLHLARLPAVEAVAWLGSWTWAFFFALLPLLLLVFPNGIPPSPRWRPLLWVALVPPVILPTLLATVNWGAPIEVLAASEEPDFGAPFSVVFEAGIVVMALSLLIALGSLAVRWHRSAGVSRQQLKVFFVHSAVGVAMLIVSQLDTPAAEVTGVIAFLLVPAGMVRAILRYRLYDIDRLVSRTVSYGVLTTTLVVGYLGLVFVLRELLPFAGDLPVAISTLAVAAAFAPLRRWIQRAVDQRFNRSRYDSERVTERLGRVLRAQAAVSHIGGGLQEVVAATLQPSHVSIWLRRVAPLSDSVASVDDHPPARSDGER